MSPPTQTSLENLTLSDAELAAYKPIAGEGGHVLRALCPFHGSDHQRSLRVTLATGRFVCFACGAWGYLEEARERWREEQHRRDALRRPPARAPRRQSQRPGPPPAATRPAPAPPTLRIPTPARPELAQQLAAFQAVLPGSRGEAYLRQRGIPLALAQQLGVGYAAPGTWPHPARDWRGGFPWLQRLALALTRWDARPHRSRHYGMPAPCRLAREPRPTLASRGPLARWRGSVAAFCQRRRQRPGQRSRAQKDAARLGCPRCLLGCQRRAARAGWAGRASRHVVRSAHSQRYGSQRSKQRPGQRGLRNPHDSRPGCPRCMLGCQARLGSRGSTP